MAINLLPMPPELEGHFATCQHPGSPWCPQQLCLLRILMALFRNKRYSFLCHGIGTDMLVKKLFKLGIFALSFSKTLPPTLLYG